MMNPDDHERLRLLFPTPSPYDRLMVFRMFYPCDPR